MTPTCHVLVLTHGYLHPLPAELPPADLELDLRRLLADPAHRPQGDMLDRTGLDSDVRAFVLATQGAELLVANTTRLVRDLADVKPVVVRVGCAGGKHRAAAVGQELADRLTRSSALDVEVRHLHVDLPRVVGTDELATS